MTDDRPTIKNEKTYDALRDDGYGKEAAARIANAQANPNQSPSRKGGQSPAYEEWTKDALIDRAGELDITGRWDMTKKELIAELRDR